MMQAKFIFEKILIRGEQKLKFVGSENVLTYSELPKEYTNGTGVFCLDNGSSNIYFSNLNNLIVDEIYTPDTIREHIVMAKKAGAKLSEIKKDLEKKNKNWKGTTTITI
jgi:hypothetical protein